MCENWICWQGQCFILAVTCLGNRVSPNHTSHSRPRPMGVRPREPQRVPSWPFLWPPAQPATGPLFSLFPPPPQPPAWCHFSIGPFLPISYTAAQRSSQAQISLPPSPAQNLPPPTPCHSGMKSHPRPPAASGSSFPQTAPGSVCQVLEHPKLFSFKAFLCSSRCSLCRACIFCIIAASSGKPSLIALYSISIAHIISLILGTDCHWQSVWLSCYLVYCLLCPQQSGLRAPGNRAVAHSFIPGAGLQWDG